MSYTLPSRVYIYIFIGIIIYEVVTYMSIGTLYLSVICPSTQCACANYSGIPYFSVKAECVYATSSGHNTPRALQKY